MNCEAGGFVNSAVNALQHWEDMWLMTLNAKKCNTMQVSSSPKPISFDYSIHNTVLEDVPIQNT